MRLQLSETRNDIEMKLKIGQHLFTRDGRVHGNAIITAVHDNKLGTRYDFETDFGNVGRSLNTAEVHEAYYTTDRDGEVRISELERWRGDRNQIRKDAHLENLIG